MRALAFEARRRRSTSLLVSGDEQNPDGVHVRDFHTDTMVCSYINI
jgi:hypothetical protein